MKFNLKFCARSVDFALWTVKNLCGADGWDYDFKILSIR